MTPERFRKIQSVLNQRQPDLTVLTDGVHKQQNLSAILRTCDAIGIHRIHWCLTPEQEFKLYHRTAGGSSQWVNVDIHHDAPATLSTMKNQGYQILAAHFSNRAINYREADYTLPTVLVMGAEKPGISDPVAEIADQHVLIPMTGMVGSYNVSVAAAIILNEAMHQRRAAGLYDQRRLADEDYHHTLFQWCHPKLAAFCDQKNIPYPNLDQDGQIIYTPEWTAQVKEVNQACD